MLSNFGNILITLCLLTTISIIYFSYNYLWLQNKAANNSLVKLSIWQTTFSITCFFTLIAGFVSSDFSLITVFQNSHSLKPLFYKITGTWGNPEGSLLLWINVLVIFSFLFLIINKNREIKYRIYTLITQNILILGFLLFLLLNSNPFNILSDASPNT